MNEIQWTKEYFEGLNERLRKVGMPEFIIRDGKVFKDELHYILGIGKELEGEKS